MRTRLYWLTTLFSLFAGITWTAHAIPVRMYCLSIEADHGTDEYGDTIDINFAARPESAGELGPFWYFGPTYYDLELPSSSSYSSYITSIYVYDIYYLRTFSGGLNVELPMFADANNNRFPDFFEVALGGSAQSTGGYSLYLAPLSSQTQYGSCTATWSRAAGSRTGTYRWAFVNNSGPLPSDWFGTFVGSFRILEYTGTLTYTPGAANVSATINLTQTGVPSNTRQGSVHFIKAPSDPYNMLTNQPGILLDAASQVYNFTNHAFFRDPNYPTNYAGYVEFDDDGDLNTVYPYAIWVLSVNDPNDSDHDGIPDFSDDATVIPLPRRPLISLASTSTNLLLTIHGDINHVHEIQRCISPIACSTWQSVVSVTLTNDPQVVPVPLPTGPAFFRVQAQ